MKMIKLSSGIEVEVHLVPPLALASVQAKFPLPQFTVDISKDTPEALEARAELTRFVGDRQRKVNDVAWLLGLPHVKYPEDWKFPEVLQFAGVTPREGDTGRKLDYIEYELMQTQADIDAVQAVMHGPEITEEEVSTAVDTTFQRRGKKI